MSASLAEWLVRREPVDHAARSQGLTQAVVAALPSVRPIRVVDLGAGRGSNRRYLAPFLPLEQEWLLVDEDAVLLEDAAAPGVRTVQKRLGALDPALFDGRHLVTASALLDLVSASWLDALAEACRREGAHALFALTYNGRSSCSPREPEDDHIRELLNRHQRNNDKGFGRAAGPDAVMAAERAFIGAGYRVRREASDWHLGQDARALQRQLVEGWADAAREIAPAEAGAIDDWLARRLGHIAAGTSRIIVGHDDFAAWPGIKN